MVITAFRNRLLIKVIVREDMQLNEIKLYIRQ